MFTYKYELFFFNSALPKNLFLSSTNIKSDNVKKPLNICHICTYDYYEIILSFFYSKANLSLGSVCTHFRPSK